MADNSLQTGTDTIRDVDRGGVKTPVSLIDVGGEAGPESLVTANNPLPVAILAAIPTGANAIGSVVVTAAPTTAVTQSGAWTVAATQSGVWTVGQSGAWTVGLSAGTQVELTDGTNVLGTAAHPVRTDPTGATTQPVSVAGSVAVTGTFWQATQPVSQSGTWTVQPGNTANSTAWLVTGTGGTFPATQSGTWNVGTVTTVSAVTAITNALPAGTNTIGAVTPAAAAAGGATPWHLISAASTNATSVKASAGTVYSLSAFNTNAAARYLKLYDKGSAPTVGTDTPVKTILIPPSNGGAATPFPVGVAFASGIALALTTGMADSDTGAVGANECCVNLDYK